MLLSIISSEIYDKRLKKTKKLIRMNQIQHNFLFSFPFVSNNKSKQRTHQWLSTEQFAVWILFHQQYAKPNKYRVVWVWQLKEVLLCESSTNSNKTRTSWSWHLLGWSCELQINSQWIIWSCIGNCGNDCESLHQR